MDGIYRQRFSNILYLMPHQTTSRKDVFTVYGGSYTFQSFILQARQQILEMNCELYAFIQDDVLLRPEIAECDLHALVDGFNSFIPNISSLTNTLKSWSWASRTLWSICNPRNTLNGSGMKAFRDGRGLSNGTISELNRLSIPCNLEFERPSLKDRGVCNIDVFGENTSIITSDQLLDLLYDGIFNGRETITLNTPLAYGVSDFFLVKKGIIHDFFDEIGLMTSAGLFAEVAIPSALIYTENNKIKRAQDCGYKVSWSFGSERDNVYDPTYINTSFEDGSLLLLHPMKWSRLVRDNELKMEWMRQVFNKP